MSRTEKINLVLLISVATLYVVDSIQGHVGWQIIQVILFTLFAFLFVEFDDE